MTSRLKITVLTALGLGLWMTAGACVQTTGSVEAWGNNDAGQLNVHADNTSK